jgi:uridine kinase
MKTFVIGVAGGSGSGKSTVTEQIINAVGSKNVAVVLQDHYYLDRSHLSTEERNKLNFDHPDAFDWGLMKRQLEDLYNGLPIDIPSYDFATHTRNSKSETILPAKVIIIEGIFALYDEDICNKMSLRIFVDTAADIRLMRRIKRDIVERGRTIDSVLTQYSQFVRPMYRRFVEPTKRKAHIIIPHGSNKAALEMIVSRINSVLNGEKIVVDHIVPYDDDSDEGIY